MSQRCMPLQQCCLWSLTGEINVSDGVLLNMQIEQIDLNAALEVTEEESYPGTDGIEVLEDDPDTVWGLWDCATEEHASRFGDLSGNVTVSTPPAHSPIDQWQIDSGNLDLDLS